jgi:hypothetical protein
MQKNRSTITQIIGPIKHKAATPMLQQMEVHSFGDG